MTADLSARARIAASIVAAAGIAALAAQAAVSFGLTGSLGATLWVLVDYFTVLTNLFVAVSFVLMAVGGRALPATWLAALALWIAIVGAIYHLLLARLWAPEGLAWWADQGLHSAVPVLCLVWWLAFAPKAGIGLRHAVLWLAWPVLYSAYAILRGMWTGLYPYPFLDVKVIGLGGVALNSIGFVVAFFVSGLAMVWVARALTR